MAVEPRPELVGKRFLCVSNVEQRLERSAVARWGWRAGVVRAVSQRDSDSSELTVYVEFDDLEWEKREWVKVYEDFRVFLLEHQLVWAKRKDSIHPQGTKNKQIQWPALAFRPLVGKPVLGSVVAVEFFSDRQLDFLTDDGAYQPYQDEVDSLNPVLRDNPQLHEEVKAWVKDQKVQEIFMQGPYSLNGYRVRVYRQDSATQWFTGIITHHDLFSRTMVVMNDQVLEPQNVDPSMVQMTFLDDVVHSLLKGENIGITSRRRSRSSQNNTAHTTGGRPTGPTGSSQGHYTRAQANSPRPVMNSSGSTPKPVGQQQQQQQQQQLQQQQTPPHQQQQHQQQHSPGQQQRGSRFGRRKGSDSSVPEDKEEKLDGSGRDYSKNKSKSMTSKRRKTEDEEKRAGMKRLKADASDLSESSDSENSNKRAADSSSEHSSESELKGKSTSKSIEKEEDNKSQSSIAVEETCAPASVAERLSPLRMVERPQSPGAAGCIVDMRSTVKTLPKEHYVSPSPRTQTPKCVIDITADECRKPEGGRKIEVIRPVTSLSETAALAERDRLAPYASIVPCIKNIPIVEDVRKSSPDILKLKNSILLDAQKPNSEIPEVSKPKPNTSPEVSKHKARHLDNPKAKIELEAPRSSFKPVPARCDSTKSPLIIDKNEHFTVYRDPALVRPEPEANHMAYMHHQHMHPLHPPHLLPGSSLSAHPSVHHSHLLLPSMPPASLLSAHPRLDLTLSHPHHPHHHSHQQQQPPPPPTMTHAGAPYSQLGLYPIIWQYPNGTHSYPNLGLPSSKWVHPENAVGSEAVLRRNTPSPWLHQHTPVTSADSLGLISHVPVRPASADPHRAVKISAHPSPPLSSKPSNDHLKEELEKKTFLDPIRTHLKQEQDRSRTPTSKESHMHRLFLESPMGHIKQGADRASKYKEENRRILQESIEVAPFTAKIRSGEADREVYLRKGHNPLAVDKEGELMGAELYKLKQSLPQSNYFTTLSNSVVNEPPRLYPSKEFNSYFEKVNAGLTVTASSTTSYTKSLCKPPPLIKHQPEGEGLAGKITEQLSQQASLHALSATVSERRSPAASPSNPLRCMPALHRAPVFHPPAYGRLSPPTLTPIQPVSTPGKLTEQQKPPTLLPEMREVGGASKPAPEAAPPEVWKPGGWRGKPPAATASVIVRPSTCIKYDGAAAQVKPLVKDEGPGSEPVVLSKDCLKTADGRVSMLNSCLEDTGSPYRKNVPVSPAPSPTPSSASSLTSSSAPSPNCTAMHYSAPTTIIHKADTPPEGRPPASASPSVAPPPTTVKPGSDHAFAGNFVHLKKHKAALAAKSRGAECEPVALQAKAVPSKALTNGQPPPTGQPNYHKLKKAWLTRHSEEDRNTNQSDKPSSTTTTGVSDIIKPCTVSLIASTSADQDSPKEVRTQEDRKSPRRGGGGAKRAYESASDSCDDSDSSESKAEQRAKRQPKPTYKKKQNDLQKKKGENDREDDDVKPNGIFRSAREKTKLKLASSNGIPRSVLKDWRKVKKLKQSGESFLQDDSCVEIGPNLQKCRECRVLRSRKGEEPTHSPVFCRFYHFRRLSYSKNGVIRIDGFSSPDQHDEEALSLWDPDMSEDNELDLDTSKYILGYIGDKFCQLVMTENVATTWIKKDTKIAWKRAVRGVREMCDACEATLFNIHWVCQKCGFVVCLDCYKAKERKSSKDKEQYTWLKCVKGQPHDHKNLMPTQIIPGSVLTDLVESMHMLREKYSIKAHCPCNSKNNTVFSKIPPTNGVSQVLQNVLNHSNKLSLCKPELQQQISPSQKPETNGDSSPTTDSSDGNKLSPPESQSPLHFLADLAEQKSREEKKENKESPLGRSLKEEKEHFDKPSSLVSNSTEQGSTLRDLLTTTAGKLRLGSTDAGIAFAPVYSTVSQTSKSGRSVPNILDDIIASVVENKIPANRTPKLSLKQEMPEEARPERKRSCGDDPLKPHADIPHCWLYERNLLWLKDHRNSNNCKLFRECWKQGQPILVSGVQKKLNANLWKAESFNQEFADHQGDLVNCKDGVVSNSGIKEFWDGFEDLTKRPRSKDGDTLVYRLKDWPSGEEFMALMPSRYDDLMKNLPLPEYSDPEGHLNLASHLPTFFVRPDLGPRLCCAYGVAASQELDFGTANLHLEVSDIVSILVYVGVAKGNGVLSKTGVLKRLEEEDLDENLKKRLKDSSEIPGALWHIYNSRDVEKIKEFLFKVAKEQDVEVTADHDPIREAGYYLSQKLRQRLLEEHGVQGLTVVQFLGDSILIPAGALHQVQNLHSCVQVINDFVSPEHVVQSFHLTQELRSSTEEINYEDKLQVKNIFYHCVKVVVGALRRCCDEELEETEQNS